MNQYCFQLFIAEKNLTIQLAIQNLHNILQEKYGENYDLEVIDLQEHPDLAQQENIQTVPTFLQKQPLPVRRLAGDVFDPKKLLYWLTY